MMIRRQCCLNGERDCQRSQFVQAGKPIERTVQLVLNGFTRALFAIDQSDHAENAEARFATSINRLRRGTAGCGDIFHDHHVNRIGIRQALDPFLQTVLLRLFSYDEGIDGPGVETLARRQRRWDRRPS